MKPDIQRAIEILRENYIVTKSYDDSTNEDAKAICDALSLAIYALEQQDEEPCEYCSGESWINAPEGKALVDFKAGYLYVKILDVYYKHGRYISESFRIDYCPRCGRRLTEEQL